MVLNAINEGDVDVKLAWGRFTYSIKAGEKKFIPVPALQAITKRFPAVKFLAQSARVEVPAEVAQEPVAEQVVEAEEPEVEDDLEFVGEVGDVPPLPPEAVEGSEQEYIPEFSEAKVSKKKGKGK